MADRLRALLDRPLDPGAARAIVVLATAIFVGLGVLALLGGLDRERSGAPADSPSAVRPAAKSADAGLPPAHASQPPGLPQRSDRGRRRPAPSRRRRQDPQDQVGSAPAQRAARELRAHRALQHVPYRQGELRIELVGARRGRAVMRVSDSSVAAARAGWRRFLRRFDDDGTAYITHFRRTRAAVDHQVALRFDHRVGLPVALARPRGGGIPHQTGDRGASILQRSLRNIEVGT